MKYLIALAVILVLFLLPAGSYYYLKKGFSFRYNALQELKTKQTFPVSDIYDFEGNKKSDFLKKKINQVYFSEPIANEKQISIFNRLEKQFKNREYFQQIILYNEKPIEEFNDEKFQGYYADGKSTEHLELNRIYLIDTSGMIRNSYDLTDEDIKKLVSHTAILLPLPKKKEIKFRRNDK